MSVVGGFGMVSTAIWQPIIGGWIDNAREKAAASGLEGDTLELAAGQATLQTNDHLSSDIDCAIYNSTILGTQSQDGCYSPLIE